MFIFLASYFHYALFYYNKYHTLCSVFAHARLNLDGLNFTSSNLCFKCKPSFLEVIIFIYICPLTMNIRQVYIIYVLSIATIFFIRTLSWDFDTVWIGTSWTRFPGAPLQFRDPTGGYMPIKLASALIMVLS